MSKQKYDSDFRTKLIKLHIEEGRTMESIKREYGLPHGILNRWVKKYREEGINNPEIKKEIDIYARVRQLEKEKAELQKENDFLKKAAAFFAKEID